MQEASRAQQPAAAAAPAAAPAARLGMGAFSDSNKAERDAAKRAATTQFGEEAVSEVVGQCVTATNQIKSNHSNQSK